MGSDSLMGAGILSAALVLFFLVAAVLWIALPFAVFGIKPRLDKIARLLESQERMQLDFVSELRAHRAATLTDEALAPVVAPDSSSPAAPQPTVPPVPVDAAETPVPKSQPEKERREALLAKARKLAAERNVSPNQGEHRLDIE